MPENKCDNRFCILPRFLLVELAELADLRRNPLRYLIGCATALCELAVGGGRPLATIPAQSKLSAVELWLWLFDARLVGYVCTTRHLRTLDSQVRVWGFCKLVFLLEILDLSQGERLASEKALRSVAEKGLPDFLDSPPAIRVERIIHGE